MEQSTKQMLFLILLALIFFLIFGGLIISQARGKNFGAHPEWNAPDNQNKPIFEYGTNTRIQAHEKITGDLLVQNGDLTLAGIVYGDVLVFSGNLIIEKTAVIHGHALVVQGELFDSDVSKIAGDILEIDGEKSKLKKRRDLPGVHKSLLQFTRKSKIDERETLDGNVIIHKGNVSVYGVVNGNLIVLDGTVKVKSGGRVIGHILSGEETSVSSNGQCTGELVQFDLKNTHATRVERRKTEMTDDREERIRERIERKYLDESRDSEDVFRFFGDVKIAANESIDGDVVVMKGDIDMAGEVEGDVVAVLGDVNLGPDAYVEGDVVSVGGKVRREVGSTVTGDVVETTFSGVRVSQKNGDDSGDRRPSRRSSRSRGDRDRERRHNPGEQPDDDDNAVFRYNRVEGLFLGLQVPRNNWWDNRDFHFALFGHLGYGFANKEARYQIGLERWFFDDLRFTLGGSLYHLTESEDTWQIPSLENSLAALFLKEDFQDFYSRKGYNFFVKQNLTNVFQVSAE